MTKKIPKNLFVFEMANNHMGELSHGIRLIEEFGKVCEEFPEFNFAFKLQYRDLDTFIHPSMQGREDVKFIKRFEETRLSMDEFDELVHVGRANNFLMMATPFDEKSVKAVNDQNLDYIKIASCSFGDWPLLERVVEEDLPIVASTAGADLDVIDQVISFFQHRKKDFAIMHCVGEYPTQRGNLHLGQIDLLKARYPDVPIGFSTHEDPADTDVIKMAIAKGAQIFEKHVGLPTDDYALNGYSANPAQVKAWLNAARLAKEICGVDDARSPTNQSEVQSLRSLRRGVFASRDIEVGETIHSDDIYFAFPPEEDQFTANDWSKYSIFSTSSAVKKDVAISRANSNLSDVRAKIWEAAESVKQILKDSQITVPRSVDLEFSHHFGMERFSEFGLTMITVVNRDYCKKVLISLPNQSHPEQYHQEKEETFHVLYGDVELTLDGVTKVHGPGDVINIEPGTRHSFVSKTGAVIEEISSTHFKDDSFYTDESINANSDRKTFLTYWMR